VLAATRPGARPYDPRDRDVHPPRRSDVLDIGPLGGNRRVLGQAVSAISRPALPGYEVSGEPALRDRAGARARGRGPTARRRRPAAPGLAQAAIAPSRHPAELQPLLETVAARGRARSPSSAGRC
jgi:hypothetical protein